VLERIVNLHDLKRRAVLIVVAEFFLSEHAGACCRFRVKNQDATPFSPGILGKAETEVVALNR
jgi:hypothetical protein